MFSLTHDTWVLLPEATTICLLPISSCKYLDRYVGRYILVVPSATCLTESGVWSIRTRKNNLPTQRIVIGHGTRENLVSDEMTLGDSTVRVSSFDMVRLG